MGVSRGKLTRGRRQRRRGGGRGACCTKSMGVATGSGTNNIDELVLYAILIGMAMDMVLAHSKRTRLPSNRKVSTLLITNGAHVVRTLKKLVEAVRSKYWLAKSTSHSAHSLPPVPRPQSGSDLQPANQRRSYINQP